MAAAQTESQALAAVAALREGLERIAPKLVAGATGVPRLDRLSGGASQETWAFDVAAPGASGEAAVSKWILRRSPPGVDPRSSMGCGLEVEARLIGLASEAGVPVPGVGHVLTPEDGIGVGFIMTRIEGETLPPKILKDPAFAAMLPGLAAQCGAALARIHGIDLARLPPLRTAPAEGEVAAYLERHRRCGTPKPVFEFAFRWLHQNMPAPKPRLALVHGDFRHGNLMMGTDGLRGVLDWELAHLGDPMEDLGWICVNSWRFGRTEMPVGGFGTREQLFEAYEAAGGMRVNPEEVRFWEVLGTLKWGVMCEGMAHAFLAGERNVERAAIGRRSSETEIDLLNLLLPR